MSKTRSICFLSSSHPATDKRVFDKEARTLAQRNYRVIHLCPQSTGEPLGHWNKDGVEIITYPRPKGLLGRARQLFQLYRRAKAVGADAYHCNEVDSWLVGAVLAFTQGKLCVVDIHEDYPSTVSEGRVPRPFRPAVAGLVHLLYRVLTPFTHRIVLAKFSIENQFEYATEKRVVVRNFARLEAAVGGIAQDPPKPSDALTIVHLGFFSKLRGWPQILAALDLIKSDLVVHNVLFEIVGEFNDGSREEFNREVERLGLTAFVRVQDWLPFSEAFSLLCRSSIGVVLFQPGIRNHVYAMPHKMFDYMMAELPIIIPDCAEEIRDVVSEHHCGIRVDTSNPKDIADALSLLINDRDLRLRMGRNGKTAVEEFYNWEREAEKLLTVYA